MTLEIILPPCPARVRPQPREGGDCRRRGEQEGTADSKLRTLEAMRAQGVPRTFKPWSMALYVYDRTGRMDLDNAVATFKRYQDGIFDALHCDDRVIMALHALRVEVHKTKVEDWRPLHRWTRCVLSDGVEDAMFVPDCGELADVLREAKGDAR